MKNASKHSENLKSLVRKFLRDAKPEPRQPIPPLEALVRAAMSYDIPDSRADEAMKVIGREFVDLNELRVATDLEIQDMLGFKYPAIEQRVTMITQCVNAIFESEHTLSLDRLKTVGKREARAFLRELPGIHPYVEAYVMLLGLDGSAAPMDDIMLSVLLAEEAVEEGTTVEDAQRFIEANIKAEDMYDFFIQLRRAAAAEVARKRGKS